MRMTLNYLIAVGACALLSSCSTIRDEKDVVHRFFQLKEAGSLPGFAPNDHGNLRTQALPTGRRMTYPASLVIYATKENDPSRYAYNFTRESASSDWELSGAWRTLQNGEREELQVK